MNHPRRLGLAILLLAVLALTLSGCKKPRSQTANPDQPNKPPRSERPSRTAGLGPSWEQNVRVRSALDQNDAPRAERLARAIVDKQPANAEAHFLLGKALMAQKKTDDARTFFEKAAALAPDNSLYRRTLAENLDLAAQEAITSDDPPRAIGYWKRCLGLKYKPAQTEQNLAEAYRAQGEALRGRKQDAEAEKAFREAMALIPANPIPRLDLANLLLGSDRLLEAERVLKDLVDAHPSFEPGHLAYVRLLHRMGDVRGAQAQIDRLLSLKPDSAAALALRAELEKEVPIGPGTPSRPRPGSTPDFGLGSESGLEPDPDLVQKLTILESTSNFQGQAQLLRDYLKEHPEGDWARLRLGMVLERAGDIPGALAAVEEFLATHADDPRAQFFKARCLQLSGDLDGALAILDILVQEKKANLQVYDEIGQVYAKKGRFDEAKAAWNKALAIDPEYAGVLFNFGQLAMEQKDFATAATRFDQAIQKEPFNLKFRFFAGLNLKQQGREAEARAAWQSAKVYLNAGDPYGARILRALGEPVPAAPPVSPLTAPPPTLTTGGSTPLPPTTLNGSATAAAVSTTPPAGTGAAGQVPGGTGEPTYLAALDAARAGQFAEAIAGFQAVLQESPNNLNARINLGKVYAAQGSQAEAALQFLLAVRASPDHPAATKALLNAYSELGLHRQAAELTGRLVQANPARAAEFPEYKAGAALPRSNPRAYEPFVRTLLQNRQPEEALPVIQAAVAENPENPKFVVLEGEVRYCLGQLEEAEKTLQHAITMDPADPEPFLKLGDLYAARQQMDQAFAQYQLAQKARFLDPDTAFSIVDRLEAIGKKTEANLLLSRLKGMNLSEPQLEKLRARTATP
ncbi:MAG: tetratricopeptide repeat protein [Candidatus Riflebacteria bacterium]|nr:tetratricopeptide repeat protein [Candidatus Riflebacteria bacterium]